ncbi:hypothetical protein [Chondrinema litorale]|uniref:hypothetical protein n=1 Tax=Chondrinema litorale TaxID=2994555 RepID=UPI002543F38A|nr:hypothetical protein [Chondrinema litorale]UZR99001.1 hypothetical protein OQ292_33935 [Chondrinema litorale]
MRYFLLAAIFILVINVRVEQLFAQENYSEEEYLINKSRQLIEEYSLLLDYLLSDKLNEGEKKIIIRNSYSETANANKVFYNDDVIIEDSFLFGHITDIPVEAYLNNLILFFDEKNAEISISEITPLYIKEKDYRFCDVRFKKSFTGYHKTKGFIHSDMNLIAHIRIEQLENDWKLSIQGIEFFNPLTHTKISKEEIIKVTYNYILQWEAPSKCLKYSYEIYNGNELIATTNDTFLIVDQSVKDNLKIISICREKSVESITKFDIPLVQNNGDTYYVTWDNIELEDEGLLKITLYQKGKYIREIINGYNGNLLIWKPQYEKGEGYYFKVSSEKDTSKYLVSQRFTVNR